MMAVKWRESLDVLEDGVEHVSHTVHVDGWRSAPEDDDTRWKVGRVIDLFTLANRPPSVLSSFLSESSCGHYSFRPLASILHCFPLAEKDTHCGRRVKSGSQTDQDYYGKDTVQTDTHYHTNEGRQLLLLWVNCNYLLASLSLRPFLLLLLLFLDSLQQLRELHICYRCNSVHQ